MQQILAGILEARVCVAQLTGKNANVFYELGIAHALKRPVVLISAAEDDVPFDLRHLRRVVYDPYQQNWRDLLKSDVERFVKLAITNPEFVFDQHKLRTVSP